jgi:hypothetical protein
MAANPDAAQVAAMLARIVELEGVNAHLNQQGVAIQNELAVSQGQLVASQEQLVAARARTAPKPKIPPPSTFSGNTGAAVDEWVLEMDRQFGFYPDYFVSDAAKITHALMFVAVQVSAWYRTCAEEHRLAGTPVVSWATFVAVMRERYQPISSSMAARANLDKITQTGSVKGYSAVFYTNMSYIKDMSPADQVHQYTRGLKPAVKLEVIKVKANSLTDAVNAAIAAEAYLPSGSGSSSSSTGYTFRPHRGGNASAATPMDVNSVGHDTALEEIVGRSDAKAEPVNQGDLWAMMRDLQSQIQSQQSLNALFGSQDRRINAGSSTKVPGISKADYERCRRENVCLRCKEPGHVANTCTKSVRSNW